MDDLYKHPYPSPELAAEHPFVPLEHERLDLDEMHRRSADFLQTMDRRRSVRLFSPAPVP